VSVSGPLARHGLLPGFVRYEQTDGARYVVDQRRRQSVDRPDRRCLALSGAELGGEPEGGLLFVGLENPHQAMYLLDRDQLSWHLSRSPARSRVRLATRAIVGSGSLMIDQLVQQIETRFAELGQQLTDPEVISDRERNAEVGRAYSQLEPVAKLAAQWRRAQDDAAGAEELLSEVGEDSEMRAELGDARRRIEELEEEIRLAMVERDPNDDKSVIVEIQGGAGGEEAGLWAGDLYRMLGRYAERRGWQAEPLDIGDGKYTFAVKGDGAYSVFKFEGGTHRVQRVPQTESQGRIHTSTATVAVLPEAEDVDVHIDPNDLQIDVYRSSGPGGQSVNTTDSAVRVTHKPSGIVVSMQDEKSQLQNREKALRVLRARLYERALAEQQAELAADRRSQVGTGDRAEKIRTYNYGERRVTDHRIKHTVHNLDQVLEGELDELTAALQADEKRRRLQAQALE
jgi:peptide chain release factor 1